MTRLFAVLVVVLSFTAVRAQSTVATAPKKVEANVRVTPPAWAHLERRLLDDMSRAAIEFAAHYTRPGGTLIWKTGPATTPDDAEIIFNDCKWKARGEASADDLYESFYNFPLLYALGGHDRLRELSFTEWNAITRQLNDDFQALRGEYPLQDDWFHQGEGNMFFYLLSLADPTDYEMVKRAKRFAGLYMNEDPAANNYDAGLKILRSQHLGSAGPYFGSAARARPYRMEPGMAVYGMPIEDVPGIATVADLEKPGAALRYDQAIEESLWRGGDVVANLNATSLIVHAYMLTGDRKYVDWVKEYAGAWLGRARANGGIVPDNVGLSGKVGEYFNGKWWGGLYGWHWPHGYHTVGQPIQIGAANALLVTGDAGYLEMPRATMDAVLALGKRDGTRGWVVPQRRANAGWIDFSRMNPTYLSQLWFMSLSREDWQRVERVRAAEGLDWTQVADTHNKEDSGHDEAWLRFIGGGFPEYPERILTSAAGQVRERLRAMRENWLLVGNYPGTRVKVEPGKVDFTQLNEHHWQHQNPVTTEALVQLMMGAPQACYNGGLLHASVRYFDPVRRRPGVPADVGALVTQVAKERIVLQLVNLNASEPREVTVQAGTFGEHNFTTVKYQRTEGGGAPEKRLAVNAHYFQVLLEPGCGVTLEMGVTRFANKPSYAFPWHGTSVPVN
jgi:hypothetical protein